MTNHITNATDGPEKTLHPDKFIKFTFKLGTIELTDHHYQSRVHDCQFSPQTQNIDNLTRRGYESDWRLLQMGRIFKW